MNDPLPSLDTLGQRVKWARERAGYTQPQLAKLLRMDQTTVSAIELDKIQNPRNLDKLAKALGVPPAWLRFGVANIETLTDKQVGAIFALAALSDQDQETVIGLIQMLSGK